MRSFGLSAFATLAFGLFCSAAPAPGNVGHAVANVGSRAIEARSNADVSTFGIRAAPAPPKCLDSIITEAVTDITAVIDDITKIKVKVTVKVITPYLAKVKAILTVAIGDCNSLVGVDTKAILTSVVGVLLDITGVAKLICSVIKIVIQLIQCVLGVVSLDIKDEVLAILLEIVDLLCQLVSCVLSLVGDVLGGLIAIVVSLLGGVTIKAIIDLNLTECISLLHL